MNPAHNGGKSRHLVDLTAPYSSGTIKALPPRDPREVAKEKAIEVFATAMSHLGEGDMISSARFCLEDALSLAARGDWYYAKHRALNSLSYSVGIMHPDYIRSRA